MNAELLKLCRECINDFFYNCKKDIYIELIYSCASSNIPAFAIFTLHKNQTGFVFVNINNQRPEILGYAHDGINEQLNFNANTQLLKFAKLYEKKLPAKDVHSSIIFPHFTNDTPLQLLSTRWAQDFPYNLYTPDNTFVGCVATALAQIIRYFQTQPRGWLDSYITQTYKYNIDKISLDNIEYNWELMPNHIINIETSEEKESVALISYHAAVGVKMDFRELGSAAFLKDGINLLVTNYNFTSNIRHCDLRLAVDSYLDSDILNILRFEIENGRPVIAAGSAHAFIADGISDREGYIHFNFGYGGTYDGFYQPSTPALWSIVEFLFNIHPNIKEVINLTKQITSDHISSEVFRGDNFSIFIHLDNKSLQNIEIAVCLTTLSGAFLHKISETQLLTPGMELENLEIKISIPEIVSISPRKIKLMWKNENSISGWKIIEPSSCDICNDLNVNIVNSENNEIVLFKSLANIENQVANETFTHYIEVKNTSNEFKKVQCTLGVTEKNNNIIYVIGKSEANIIPPNSTMLIQIKCSLENLKTNISYQAKIFFSYDDDIIFLMSGYDESVNNIMSVWAINTMGFRNDITITEMINLPESRTLSWAESFKLDVSLKTSGYSESVLPINSWALIAYDDMYNVTTIDELTGISITDNTTFNIQFNVAISRSLQDGLYNLAIVFRSPQHNYENQIINANNSQENPVLISVLHTILSSKIRLTQSIDAPEIVQTHESLSLRLYFTLDSDAKYDDLYYPFGADIVLTSETARFVVGNIPGTAVMNKTTSISNVVCNFSDVSQGLYTLSIYAYDFYTPTDKALVQGMNELIISEKEIMVII